MSVLLSSICLRQSAQVNEELSSYETQGWISRGAHSAEGQSYHIATVYVERLTNRPPIKAKDSIILCQFSVLLTGCKNTLSENTKNDRQQSSLQPKVEMASCYRQHHRNPGEGSRSRH